jgi:hypothetical protein
VKRILSVGKLGYDSMGYKDHSVNADVLSDIKSSDRSGSDVINPQRGHILYIYPAGRWTLSLGA